MKSIKFSFASILFGTALGLPLALAVPATLAADPTLFEIDAKPYSAADLFEGGRLGLLAVERRRCQGLQDLVDKEVLALFFQEEVKRQGKSVDAVRDELLAVPEPAEKAIRAFFEERKDRVKKPYEAVRGKFAGYLKK
uniref:Uncharacterized protein n=1 Tax=Candidatus Kentrum sp. TC TaxID=2126339 RepID=A0A451AE59_9GAMM|nr:MAG: hypothetical protein BECKTC1821F_GA0114240_11216 [Candidatus Kentron sp. TC]